MARTVTIPESYKPLYTVWVNGVKYEYPAGETVEVPDGVADVIENDYALDPKEDPDATNAPSYNSLADKPFYEETVIIRDTLTWDGNTEGLAFFDGVGVPMYRVSAVTPTKEEIMNGYTATISNGETTVVTADMAAEFVQEPVEGTLLLYSERFPCCVILTEDLDINPKGTYLASMPQYDENGDAYFSTLTINGYKGFESTQTVVKPLDGKYLPKMDYIPELDSAPTANDFNRLLSYLCEAGYMKNE